ncbi:MAG: hypothetical protein A2137_07745 [Chloroflexi bacterium RBG_16_58_8]|nr:MAG: hypothetical protein A2137_07745 [Chloroflexi bacterium RBG_16_58_8]
MTMIKICGMKNEERAVAAARAGANIIGLVLADSPRRITPEQAEKITAALKKSKLPVEIAGIFVNEPIGRVRSIADTCGLDWVQLSGDEPWEYCRELARPIIKVVRLSPAYTPGAASENLAYGSRILDRQKIRFLLDSRSGEKYGGTGKTFDWPLAEPVARQYPVIIAGGLTPANVGEAIKTIRPWGVDVSSGVETKGVKDMVKIMKFIAAVRRADDSAT